MSNQFTSIRLRGVERHKAPTLADDGGASFCHNLRPAVSGLEIVKNKPLVYRIGDDGSGAEVYAAEADGRAPEITTVYRHRALPKGHYLVVINKREVTLWKEADGDGTELEQVPGEKENQYNKGYPARYDEDIIALGELNNILVVRTETRQDYFLWNDGAYSYMPAIAAPKYAALTQDYDFTDTSIAGMPQSEKDKYSQRAKKRGRSFFQAIIGFHMTAGDEFLAKYRESLNSCLQFIQGIRADDEVENRKAGRFVGHVLVRTALKTAQGNYVAYGQVLHAEIGSWYGNLRSSNFYTSDDAEKSANIPWYKRIYAKMIDDNLGGECMLLPDGGNGGAGFYPLSQFRPGNPVPKFSVYREGDAPIPNCGHSQLPVLVGTFPKKVWMDDAFRGKFDSGETKAYAGVLQKDEKNAETMPVGVYAPSIFYSFPILKILINNVMSDDGLSVGALEYYSANNIIQSICVAMTAPVKHGAGTQLYKNGTLKRSGWFEFSGGSSESDRAELGEEYADKTDEDMFDVYGYARNIDSDPDRLLARNFYIVKNIPLKTILDDIGKFKKDRESSGNVSFGPGGYWYSIPLQLKDLGVSERLDDSGMIVAEVSGESVDFSQEDMLDADRVSLNNIELAKPLPTDNFTAHRVMGKKFFDYNRRLHLFDTETILFGGNNQSPVFPYDVNGYGAYYIESAYVDELYMEYEIETESRVFIERTKINQYMTPRGKDGINKMVLNDILVYPDYRCRKIRVVERINGKWYLVDNAEWECKNSILNNISYYANVSEDINDIPKITFATNGDGFSVVKTFDRKDANSTQHSRFVGVESIMYAPQGGTHYDATKAIHAYREDDTLIYMPIIIDRSKKTELIRDEDVEHDTIFGEGNRVQVSETDDLFYYPSKNSYRVGTLDNEFVAVNSMYGQVTEQKFGMFPLYMFTKEGIFTLEQGTGDILYQNVSKINDDCLTSPRSLCNAGDMIAYVVKNGLKLIQGKSAMLVSEIVRGRPHPIVDVPGVTGDEDFVDEIQGGYMLWDEYHNDVLMLCPRGGETPPEAGHILWAYNTLAKTFYGRGDAINPQGGGMRDVGVVENAKNLAWGGNINLTEMASPAKHALNLKVWDYNKADELTPGVDTTLRFAYVSNLYRLGMNGYKHMERLVMRAFGNVGSLKITLYGSLDGRRCYKIGESRDIREVDDATLRRSPCSFVYFGFSIIGDAVKDNDADMKDIVLQISQIDIELRQKYAGKLR